MRFQPMRRAFWRVLVLAAMWGGAGSVALGQASPNLKMGNPSQAQADPSNKNNFLLDRDAFATSYNNEKGTPNWVSWRLAASDLGRNPREPFYADPDLPEGLRRVSPNEYTRSGFDRGHMCPHGDRTATPESSHATFAMTNIIPQSHDVNTMAWDALESYIRNLAKNQGKVCYIIDGPAGVGGTGKNGLKTKTPDGRVVVPESCWKVAMILDQDVASARDLTPDSAIRLIAVIMPNADGAVTEDWVPFQTTVRQVEELTGFTFFGEVDPAIINPLKGQVDDARIAPAPRLVRGRIPTPEVRPAVAEPPTPREDRPMNQAAMAELQAAIQGLTFPSESDEPFQVVDLGKDEGPMTEDKLSAMTQQPRLAQVERVDTGQFFARLTVPQPTPGQVDPEVARRYSKLLEVLNTHLTDIQVVKFGQGEVAIYIIGRTKDGTHAGVRTAATET